MEIKVVAVAVQALLLLLEMVVTVHLLIHLGVLQQLLVKI
jgi:hypothetical protein